MVSLRRSILVLFCCAAVLLAAGCGGGGGSHHLSETAFRARANSICRGLSTEAKATAGSNSKADVQRAFARIDAAVSNLERLDPPARDKQRYQALLTNFKATVDFIRTNRERLIRMTNRLSSNPSDRRTLHRLQLLMHPFEHKVQLAGNEATSLGLADCASGFSGEPTGSGSGVGTP